MCEIFVDKKDMSQVLDLGYLDWIHDHLPSDLKTPYLLLYVFQEALSSTGEASKLCTCGQQD